MLAALSKSDAYLEQQAPIALIRLVVKSQNFQPYDQVMGETNDIM